MGGRKTHGGGKKIFNSRSSSTVPLHRPCTPVSTNGTLSTLVKPVPTLYLEISFFMLLLLLSGYIAYIIKKNKTSIVTVGTYEQA